MLICFAKILLKFCIYLSVSDHKKLRSFSLKIVKIKDRKFESFQYLLLIFLEVFFQFIFVADACSRLANHKNDNEKIGRRLMKKSWHDWWEFKVEFFSWTFFSYKYFMNRGLVSNLNLKMWSIIKRKKARK